jgi:hypothetical protein
MNTNDWLWLIVFVEVSAPVVALAVTVLIFVG